MNKKINIITVILEITIFIVIILLGIHPFFKNKDNTFEKLIVEKIPKETNPLNNIVFVELGINPLIDGEGIVLKNNNLIIEQGGTYNLAGVLLNSSIYIDTPDDVVINLNGVNISNSKEVMVVKKARSITINIPKGSSNYFQDGDKNTYTGALTFNSPVTFTGEGKLLIVSSKKAIDTTKDITIKEGELIFVGNSKIEKISNNSQDYVSYSFQENIKPSLITLEDSHVIINENILKEFNNIFISSKNIKKNNSYSLYSEIDGLKTKIN